MVGPPGKKVKLPIADGDPDRKESYHTPEGSDNQRGVVERRAITAEDAPQPLKRAHFAIA